MWKLRPSFPDNLGAALLLNWAMLPAFVVLGRVLLRDLGVGPRASWQLAAAMASCPR